MKGSTLEPIAFERTLLRQFSLSFAGFYDYCIDHIDLTVVWFWQRPGERRSWVILEPFPGEAHIWLSREVPGHLQEIHAAEELWHVVQYCEGFYHVVPERAYREWGPVATALSSLLLDPLAYEAMPSFGLDLEPWFLDEVGQKAKRLEDVRLMMRDFERFGPEEVRMYWGALLIFASAILELPSPFLENVKPLYCSEFPSLWETAEALISAVRSHGFDSPEQQAALLEWILEENDLTRFLTLTRRSSAHDT